VQEWKPVAGDGLRLADASVFEGDAKTTSAIVTMGLQSPIAHDICVWYHTDSQTATGTPKAGALDGTRDYLSQGSATTPVARLMKAGTVTSKISVTVYGDTVVEDDETFSVLVDKVTAATAGLCSDPNAAADPAVTVKKPSATVTILNDDVGTYQPAS
jgi:hypothetical protein